MPLRQKRDGATNVKVDRDARGSSGCHAASHAGSWQFGAQTISVRPKTRLGFSEEL